MLIGKQIKNPPNKSTMKIDNKFNIGQTVYLVTDIDQNEWMVTSITVSPNGILYNCSFGTINAGCYDIELSANKDVLRVCGIEKESN